MVASLKDQFHPKTLQKCACAHRVVLCPSYCAATKTPTLALLSDVGGDHKPSPPEVLKWRFRFALWFHLYQFLIELGWGFFSWLFSLKMKSFVSENNIQTFTGLVQPTKEGYRWSFERGVFLFYERGGGPPCSSNSVNSLLELQSSFLRDMTDKVETCQQVIS